MWKALYEQVQTCLGGGAAHEPKSILSDTAIAIARLKVQIGKAESFCGDSASHTI